MGRSGACTAECRRSMVLCPYGAVSALFLCCAVLFVLCRVVSVLCRLRAAFGHGEAVFSAGREGLRPSLPAHVSRAPFSVGGVFCRASLPVSGKSPLRPLHKALSPATERVAACSCAFMGHFRLCLHGRVPQKQGPVPSLFPRCFCVVPSPAAFGHGEAVRSDSKGPARSAFSGIPAEKSPRPFPGGGFFLMRRPCYRRAWCFPGFLRALPF